MLTALNSNNSVVLFNKASKGTQYFCPECKNNVVFRHGKIKIPHFSHVVKTPSCGLNPETKAHLFGKYTLFNLLHENGWENVSLEKPFNEIRRRSDVYAETMDESNNLIKVVFEIQNSKMCVDEVVQRIADYKKIGVYVVWVPVFKSFDCISKDSLFGGPSPGVYLTKDIKVTDWQVLMIGYHEGLVISVVKKGNNHEMVLLRLKRIYREGSTWYDENGEEQSSSGHTLSNTYEAYLVIVEPKDTICIHERNRVIKNDRKKGWSLLQTFGPKVLETQIERKNTLIVLPTFPRDF